MFDISTEMRVIEIISFIGKELLQASIFGFIISGISLESVFPWGFFIHHMCEVLFIKVRIIIKHFVSWHPMHIILSPRFFYFEPVSLKVIPNFLSLFYCKIIICMGLSSNLIISGRAIICWSLFLYFGLFWGLCLCLWGFWLNCLFLSGLLICSFIEEVSIQCLHVFSEFFL